MNVSTVNNANYNTNNKNSVAFKGILFDKALSNKNVRTIESKLLPYLLGDDTLKRVANSRYVDIVFSKPVKQSGDVVDFNGTKFPGIDVVMSLEANGRPVVVQSKDGRLDSPRFKFSLFANENKSKVEYPLPTGKNELSLDIVDYDDLDNFSRSSTIKAIHEFQDSLKKSARNFNEFFRSIGEHK